MPASGFGVDGAAAGGTDGEPGAFEGDATGLGRAVGPSDAGGADAMGEEHAARPLAMSMTARPPVMVFMSGWTSDSRGCFAMARGRPLAPNGVSDG